MAAGALITALCYGVVRVLDALSRGRLASRAAESAEGRQRRQGRADAADAARVIMERQIARLERVLDEHQTLLNAHQEGWAACREDCARVRTYAEILHARVEACFGECEVGRHKFGPVPPLPPPARPGPSHEDLAFRARTAGQAAELAKAVDERLKGAAEPPRDLGGAGT